MKGTLIAFILGTLILVPLIIIGGYWVSIGYVLGGCMALVQQYLMEKLDS